jgi:hypothetical protein
MVVSSATLGTPRSAAGPASTARVSSTAASATASRATGSRLVTSGASAAR